jgi:hypothetical protein
MLLSGSVRAPADMGEFKFASFYNLKPRYQRDDGAHLFWYEGKNEKEWRVWKGTSSGNATFNTVSGDDVATPDLVTDWRTKSGDGWQAEKISIQNTCAKAYTASPTPSPTSIEYAAAPDLGPSSPPTTLSERYPQAGFGILNKPNPTTQMKQVPLRDASPRDFTWLHNVSQCVDLLQTAQRDAIRKAEASKATPEEMCGSQVQLLPEQECGQRSYADHELEWAVISYDVEFAPFRTGNAEQRMFCFFSAANPSLFPQRVLMQTKHGSAQPNHLSSQPKHRGTAPLSQRTRTLRRKTVRRAFPPQAYFLRQVLLAVASRP